MFFITKKFNVIQLCFHLLFYSNIPLYSNQEMKECYSFQNPEIATESYVNVGKSLQKSDLIDSNHFVEKICVQDIYNILDEIYYLELYIKKLQEV